MEFKNQTVIFVGKERKKSTKGNEYIALSISDGAYPMSLMAENSVNYDSIELFNPVQVDLSITLGKYPKATLLQVHPQK